jgi:hypothetical protein
MPAGNYRLSIGNLHSSFVIPQGVYFLKLRTGDEAYCSKLLLVN